MNIQVHNTLTKKKEPFTPVNDGNVNIYLCGPTVYDFAHLGHGRSAVAFDVIRRYFIYKGYNVKFASNYTDIDDKMIERAKADGISVAELAEKIIPHYIEDYGKLNVMPSDMSPKATDFIEEMVSIIESLEKKGITYKLEDGIYYDISKDKEYGKLSGQKLDELQAGARVAERIDKRNHQDFVLWKFEKPNEPAWDSQWGSGRPGWHIECSAMSMKLFGETFDIHAGGLDLIFPHHECEIAQSELATGKPYVKYWLHNGFVQVDNEKMSKSLGNFFTLKDIFKKYDPKGVRLFLISTHYRGPINFSDVQLEQASQTLQRFNDFIFNLKTYESDANHNPKVDELIERVKKEFEENMDNDFEVPGALASIFTFIKETNILMRDKHISVPDAMELLNTLRAFDTVLGILDEEKETELIDVEIDEKIKLRDELRAKKDFAAADEIRKNLFEQGIELIDTPDGVKWRRKA